MRTIKNPSVFDFFALGLGAAYLSASAGEMYLVLERGADRAGCSCSSGVIDQSAEDFPGGGGAGRDLLLWLNCKTVVLREEIVRVASILLNSAEKLNASFLIYFTEHPFSCQLLWATTGLVDNKIQSSEAKQNPYKSCRSLDDFSNKYSRENRAWFLKHSKEYLIRQEDVAANFQAQKFSSRTNTNKKTTARGFCQNN